MMSKLNFLKEIFYKSGGNEVVLEKDQNIELQIEQLTTAAASLMGRSDNVGIKNCTGVIVKAMNKIEYNGVNERIDQDKIKRLIDLSTDFSSDDMQEYVAGILAGEYNNPGSYSLQTMSIIRNLSKFEMETFRKFAGMIVNGEYLFGNFFMESSENLPKLNSKGIGYTEYLYMQELGLFSGSQTLQTFHSPKDDDFYSYVVNICQRKFIFQYNREVKLRNSLLTNAGRELYKLVEPTYDDELIGMLKAELLKQGFQESNIPISNSQSSP